VASKPVQAAALRNNDAPALEEKTPKKSGGLQISMTTLLLGFSTTVLAVVLIMLLVQRQSAPAPTPPSPALQQEVRAANAAPAAQQPETPTDSEGATRPTTLPSKAPNTPSLTDTKSDRPKRPTKSQGTAAKSAGAEDESGDDPKQKKPKHYIPNDL
jgi:cytoskeletal protein RodZ